MDADRGGSRVRLPALSLAGLASVQLDAEEFRPEAMSALWIVRGKLNQRQRGARHRPHDTPLALGLPEWWYGRREMPERKTDRRREPGRTHASPSPLRRGSNPILALQRSIGNRAVVQVLARTAVRTGTVQIGAVGEIKVKGGNLEAWTGTGALDWVEVTSKKGKHSTKLEKLSTAGTRIDVKVTISPANEAGEELSVGGGTLLEIKDARIKRYTVDDDVETWRVADFEKVARTKTSHKVA
jgi:hypothetical protein